MAGLVLAGAAGLARPEPAAAWSAPRELLVFYGWPSRINGAPDATAAAAELGRYDYVVLGAGAEDPAHPDHGSTLAVLAHPAMGSAFVFGYVNLGVSNGYLPLDEVKSRIDNWQVAGADAVMLDAFGYDYGVTRERQNAAVEYAHSIGMPVMANAWLPADAFGAGLDPVHNPEGLPSLLGSGDYYLSESYVVMDGQYVPENQWRTKAAELADYRDRLGFSVLSITTNDPGNDYVEAMFFAAWHAAAADGHVATGWGEYSFSALDGLAPYRERPRAADVPPPSDRPPAIIDPPPRDPGEGDQDHEDAVPSASCDGEAATIVGTPGADMLVGTAGPDVIAGLGGNDTIRGLGGDDLICGGAGGDYIAGGEGADRLFGGGGSDQLFGDAGDDVLRGNAGDDRLSGGEGADRLLGGAGADELFGGDGDDFLAGQRDDDLLRGDAGSDRARGGPQTDSCEAERTFACEG